MFSRTAVAKSGLACWSACLALSALGCAHAPPRMGFINVPATMPRHEAHEQAANLAVHHHLNLVFDRAQLSYAAPDLDFTPGMSGQPNNQPRVGERAAVVDMQRALDNCKEGQEAKRVLKAEFEAKQAELNRMQDVLKAKYNGDGEVIRHSPESFALRTRFEQLREELRAHEQQMTDDLLTKLLAEVAELAKVRGVDVVLDASAKGHDLVYRGDGRYPPGGADLTDDLVRLHDEHTAK